MWLGPIIGREADIAAVSGFFRRDGKRLVTLTGPGGVGKTRLAEEVAARLVDSYADGVAAVSLATVADPALVLPTVARTLNLQAPTNRHLPDLLVDDLRDREMLLVLDNLEQVTEVGPELALLLRECRYLALLATSLRPLHVVDEQEIRVKPLVFPVDRSGSVETIAKNSAIEYFVHVARSKKADFALTKANVADVVEICRMNDGLPLAIQLAATQTKLLTPSVLRSWIERRKPLPVPPAGDLPPRQRTLEASISSSYGMLTTPEQALFRRLCIFVGGWTIGAAEAILGPHDAAHHVADGISRLFDHSLIVPQAEGEGEPRFGMLETIRDFGRKQLNSDESRHAVAEDHARFFLSLAQEASAERERDRELWLRMLTPEMPNLRTAMDWVVAQDDAEAAGRFCLALWRFWERGAAAEGRGRVENVLAMGALHERAIRIRLLRIAGTLAQAQGDMDRARAAYADALSTARDQPDELATLALTLTDVAGISFYEGNDDNARAQAEEALALARAAPDSRDRHSALNRSLNRLGCIAYVHDDLEEAEAFYGESKRLAEEWKDRSRIDDRLQDLAFVAAARGDVEQSVQGFLAGLETYVGSEQEPRDDYRVAAFLIGMADVAAQKGSPDRSATLLGSADALLARAGIPVPRFLQTSIDRATRSARGHLGDAFDTAVAKGRDMNVNEAVALARSPTVPYPGGLTKRQWEIAQMVGAGLSNNEIANQLSISKRTVAKHLEAVYVKLVDSGAIQDTEGARDNSVKRNRLRAWVQEQRSASAHQSLGHP